MKTRRSYLTEEPFLCMTIDTMVLRQMDSDRFRGEEQLADVAEAALAADSSFHHSTLDPFIELLYFLTGSN